ncbi:MAG: hypothetical protein MZU97_18700 [Bacillus subtilis]|nr:hypothetical protein [Bacillus subtilis]
MNITHFIGRLLRHGMEMVYKVLSLQGIKVYRPNAEDEFIGYEAFTYHELREPLMEREVKT